MPRAPGFDRGWKEDNGQQPMVNVSLAEARAFCAKEGGRLPTSAEWEYAARAQDTGEYFGQDRLEGFANFAGKHCPKEEQSCEHYDHYVDVAPVGEPRRDMNKWWLIDMAGNVSEITDEIERHGSDGQPVASMSVSGGNFSDPATGVKYSLRRTVYAGGVNTAGFRCVIPYGK
jgi:formylglycine-generating enzyme required for sulfatase activity